VEAQQLQNILEAALMAAGKPLSTKDFLSLFEGEDYQPSKAAIKLALNSLRLGYDGRGIELVEVASGFRFQAKTDYAPWVSRLWEDKPPRYSRALLETLALIAYRQPVTRGDIEQVRGVAVSSHIVRTLLDRDWIRVVGHKEVPGRPAMYATTKAFLDYFNLKSLEQMPVLAELQDLETLAQQLNADDSANENTENTETQTDAEALEIESSNEQLND